MTTDETARIFMLFKTVYRDFVPEDEWEAKAQLNTWQRIFDKTPYKEAEWAAERCIESCTFPPKPADMKSYLGMGRTLYDRQAALPYHYDKPQYATEIHMQAVFEKLMRDLA